MMKKYWYKAAALALTGALFSWGIGGGCLAATVQRLLVDLAFSTPFSRI